MLSIRKPSHDDAKCTPNILPCQITHDGPLNSVERFWAPEKAEDGNATAYFRGRKLQGKALKVPDGYRGAVIQSTDKVLPQQSQSRGIADTEEIDDDDEPMEEVKIAEEVASFDEILVWGHESIPAGTEDTYIKGVEEWIQFAQVMHSGSEQTSNDSKS